MTKPNCCPTCQDWIESVPGARIPVCSNPACECHTANASVDKNGHKIDAQGNLIFDDKCHACDAPKASSPASKLRRVEAVGVGDNNGFFEFTANASSPESEWMRELKVIAKEMFTHNDKSVPKKYLLVATYIFRISSLIRKVEAAAYERGLHKGYEVEGIKCYDHTKEAYKEGQEHMKKAAMKILVTVARLWVTTSYKLKSSATSTRTPSY